MKLGDKGWQVRDLHKLLIQLRANKSDLGYDWDDMFFGENTARLVVKLQESLKLVPTAEWSDQYTNMVLLHGPDESLFINVKVPETYQQTSKVEIQNAENLFKYEFQEQDYSMDERTLRTLIGTKLIVTLRSLDTSKFSVSDYVEYLVTDDSVITIPPVAHKRCKLIIKGVECKSLKIEVEAPSYAGTDEKPLIFYTTDTTYLNKTPYQTYGDNIGYSYEETGPYRNIDVMVPIDSRVTCSTTYLNGYADSVRKIIANDYCLDLSEYISDIDVLIKALPHGHLEILTMQNQVLDSNIITDYKFSVKRNYTNNDLIKVRYVADDGYLLDLRDWEGFLGGTPYQKSWLWTMGTIYDGMVLRAPNIVPEG